MVISICQDAASGPRCSVFARSRLAKEDVVTAAGQRSARREGKRALYRERVLEAAQGVFAEHGYDDAKMEEISREAGLALGTLYSVFSGKAEIFRAVHESADRELLRRAGACVRESDDPLERVSAGLRA